MLLLLSDVVSDPNWSGLLIFSKMKKEQRVNSGPFINILLALVNLKTNIRNILISLQKQAYRVATHPYAK